MACQRRIDAHVRASLAGAASFREPARQPHGVRCTERRHYLPGKRRPASGFPGDDQYLQSEQSQRSRGSLRWTRELRAGLRACKPRASMRSGNASERGRTRPRSAGILQKEFSATHWICVPAVWQQQDGRAGRFRHFHDDEPRAAIVQHDEHPRFRGAHDAEFHFRRAGRISISKRANAG